MNMKPTNTHPWQSGPTELFKFALEHFRQPDEINRRISFLLFDIGVETLFKTSLTLPEEVTQTLKSFFLEQGVSEEVLRKISYVGLETKIGPGHWLEALVLLGRTGITDLSQSRFLKPFFSYSQFHEDNRAVSEHPG